MLIIYLTVAGLCILVNLGFSSSHYPEIDTCKDVRLYFDFLAGSGSFLVDLLDNSEDYLPDD